MCIRDSLYWFPGFSPAPLSLLIVWWLWKILGFSGQLFLRAGLPSVFKASGIPRFFYPSRRRSKSSLFFLSYLYRRSLFLSGFTFFIFFTFFLPARIAPFLTGTEKEGFGLGQYTGFLFSSPLPSALLSGVVWGLLGQYTGSPFLPFQPDPWFLALIGAFGVSILDSWVTILERFSVYLSLIHI